MTSLIKPTRRGFVTGLVALVAAPAIIRAGNFMPVKQMLAITSFEGDDIVFTAMSDIVHGAFWIKGRSHEPGQIIPFPVGAFGDFRVTSVSQSSAGWEYVEVQKP